MYLCYSVYFIAGVSHGPCADFLVLFVNKSHTYGCNYSDTLEVATIIMNCISVITMKYAKAVIYNHHLRKLIRPILR